MTLTLYSPSPTFHFRFRPRAAQISVDSPSTSQSQRELRTGVAIIGAGLAGLAAATRLSCAGVPFLLLEASDAVGGRVRTDTFDGFLLDRGFQIFITAYPEAQQLLDYRALDLRRFYSGAQVYYGGRFHTVADPFRHFADSLASLTNPIGSVADKLLVGLRRFWVLTRSDEELLFSPEETTAAELLRRIGLSGSIVDRFFRPFFGGIFFDNDLETTSRLFDFIFKCLALGDNALPATGISAIPEQLAARLPPSSILLNSKVGSVDLIVNDSNESVDSVVTLRLQNGAVLQCEHGVIVAVEQPEAERLLGLELGKRVVAKPGFRSTACVYFSADAGRVPVRDPVLFLNGSGEGIVNNMFFATNVAPSYGPPGKALVSVSLVGAFDGASDDDLAAKVLKELSEWFGGSVVGSWKHLRTYRIRFAQPDQSPPTDLRKHPRIGSGVYVCGDHRTSATFDGALVSGREAAEVLLTDIG